MQYGDDNKRYTAACVQGDNPPCTCACPFNFDIKKFIQKIKAGKFSSAYRDYANKVVFPGIVTEICEARCQADCFEAVDVKALERAVVRHTPSREPLRLSLPPRKGTVAIVGGGLSGLACAHKLAVKKYPVTVFERAPTIGGSLGDAISEVEYLAEFDLQFRGIDYTLHLNHEISSLAELSEFTAVYVATGADSHAFNLGEGWNSQSLATTVEGIFFGGKAVGGRHMDALAHGAMAAISIERYLKIQDMGGQAEFFYNHTCSLPPRQKNTDATPVRSIDNVVYTEEEAKREAARCALCDCTRCFDTCPFMRETTFMPKRMEAEAAGARHTEGLVERIGTRMVTSCALCGHCEAVCDHGVSLEQLLRYGKIVLFEQGAFAPPYHDFYLRDMDLMMEDAFLSLPAPGGKPARFLLFPGCQVAASNPEHVEKAYAYMMEHETASALLLACCGVPALYAGDVARMKRVQDRLREEWLSLGQPTLVAACPTCMKTFAEFLPEIPLISLFEFIDTHGLPAEHLKLDGAWAVFDPCGSRNFPEMQKAVRSLAKEFAMPAGELPEHGSRALCCGMGGHIYGANPHLAGKFLQQATTQSDAPYLAYCANCRNLFLREGKRTVHVLDAVFGTEPLRRSPHITEGKWNRLTLKRDLLRKYQDVDISLAELKFNYNLVIDEALYRKMDDLLISRENVEAVIKHAIDNSVSVSAVGKSSHFANLRIGLFTYWVEFTVNGATIEVLNTYSHRIVVT